MKQIRDSSVLYRAGRHRAELLTMAVSLDGHDRTLPAGALSIMLRGDLAALLRFASNKQKPSDLSAAGLGLLSQGSLVAGTGFEPVTFRL